MHKKLKKEIHTIMTYRFGSRLVRETFGNVYLNNRNLLVHLTKYFVSEKQDVIKNRRQYIVLFKCQVIGLLSSVLFFIKGGLNE